MTRWLIVGLVGLGCSGPSESADPVDLGGECERTEDCRSGLSCTGGVCAGSGTVQARVSWLQTDVPDDTLHVGVLTEAERGQLVGTLDPAIVKFMQTFPTPAYPVDVDIAGLEIGRYYLVAFVPISETENQIAGYGDRFVRIDGFGLVLDDSGDELEQPVGIGIVGQVNLP